LLLVLDLRAEAISIYQQLESALNGGSLSAIRKIAGAMDMINASDCSTRSASAADRRGTGERRHQVNVSAPAA